MVSSLEDGAPGMKSSCHGSRDFLAADKSGYRSCTFSETLSVKDIKKAQDTPSYSQQ